MLKFINGVYESSISDFQNFLNLIVYTNSSNSTYLSKVSEVVTNISYVGIYDLIFLNNNGYISYVNLTSSSIADNFILFNFLSIFFKVNVILFIIYTIFFLSYLENYIKQIIYLNNFVRLFILNESEKEVGPVDDFFFFAILFLLTLSSFIICSLFFIIFNTNNLVWIFGALLLVSVLILTVPTNLFIDFGISFVVYIRGSASSASLVKELLFDIISTATVFIRFVIQNIRFLFIFSAIFELLEWVFSNNSSLFLINYYSNTNIFINFSNYDYLFITKNFNVLVINSILFIILYFYYFLHLLFLLLVQVTIYVGISVWLFFFLYSTKFLGKYEKFFIFKKN